MVGGDTCGRLLQSDATLPIASSEYARPPAGWPTSRSIAGLVGDRETLPERVRAGDVAVLPWTSPTGGGVHVSGAF